MSSSKKLSDKTIETVEELVGTMTIDEVAKKAGITVGSAIYIARSRGLSVAFNRAASIWTKENQQFLIDNAGKLKAKDIAKKINIGVQAVYNRASLFCISLKVESEDHHKLKYSEHDVYLCRELFKEGIPVKDIVKKMEMSKSSVYEIVKDLRV